MSGELRTPPTETTAPAHVVVIDDEEKMVRIVSKILQREGLRVTEFCDPIEALHQIPMLQPDVVLCDIMMPGIDGMEVLARLRNSTPDVRVLLITAFGTIDGAIRALKDGASDYVTKPFDLPQLIAKVQAAIDSRRPADAPAGLNALASATTDADPTAWRSPDDWPAELERRLVGQSPAMIKVREIIMKVAATDSCVLIRGESGCGKEVVARSIHDISPRGRERLVALNCAAIPENLIESELFGHEQGAFTGAHKRKIGIIEAAAHGTLFLDEIGELPLQSQGRLLRVLEEKKVQPLGGLDPIPVDVRIIAATNRNLEAMVRENLFRADLFYRLNVIRLTVPPLRERMEDFDAIAQALLARLSRRRHKQLVLPAEVAERLRRHQWPGNVRELENTLERLMVLADDGIARVEMLPGELLDLDDDMLWDGVSTPLPAAFREARNQFEMRYMTELLKKCGGSITEAARLSEVSRRNLYDKIEKLGIDLEQFKKP